MGSWVVLEESRNDQSYQVGCEEIKETRYIVLNLCFHLFKVVAEPRSTAIAALANKYVIEVDAAGMELRKYP
jgi:hypothetical protein